MKNPSLYVLALIMLVNAVAYGVIIPLLYPYAERFGIGPVGLSVMFAAFSLAQFFATPIIGRLSDRFGRKPLLVICIFGTALSLALFASATSIVMLFLARIIDGITGGNNSVAQAVIADSTKGPERAKAFGVLGAAFGLGFIVGPALGGFLSAISLTAPFWFASGLALVATLLGAVILKETLPKEARTKKHLQEPLFRFDHIFKALFSPSIGSLLLVGFIGALALNGFIIGFQSFTVDTLKMTTTEIGILFSIFGVISVVMQVAGIRVLLQQFKSKAGILLGSLMLSAVALFIMSISHSMIPFAVSMFVFAIVSSPQNPMMAALISERTRIEDQGGVFGLNQSYTSLGQVVGPLAAGGIATVSLPLVFVGAGALFLVSAFFGRNLTAPVKHPIDL